VLLEAGLERVSALSDPVPTVCGQSPPCLQRSQKKVRNGASLAPPQIVVSCICGFASSPNSDWDKPGVCSLCAEDHTQDATKRLQRSQKVIGGAHCAVRNRHALSLAGPVAKGTTGVQPLAKVTETAGVSRKRSVHIGISDLSSAWEGRRRARVSPCERTGPPEPRPSLSGWAVNCWAQDASAPERRVLERRQFRAGSVDEGDPYGSVHRAWD